MTAPTRSSCIIPGVGSSDSYVDKFTGGLLGTGLAQNIREDNFICANYVDGDDIVLIGFLRGAFTARSVANMIATVSLLTPSGLGHFYAVFEDYESMTDVNRDLTLFLDPQVLPYDGEKVKAKRGWEKKRKLQYEEWLTKNGYTRHKYQDGTTEIKIKAIDHVENAFHALHLDEPRCGFPKVIALLEADDTSSKFPTYLSPLSSVGVEFDPRRMEAIFNQGLRYSVGHPFSCVPQGSWVSWLSAKKFFPWAKPEISAAKISSVKRDAAERNGKDSHPAGSEEDLWKLARPWGLGLMRDPGGRLQTIGGTTI
ncbi:hypothetical protein CGGC5_v008730 [Colletotrichum fructicola Nara gc5]|uniref:T6SS Phospholipase effector Tle1-like catalytic domain-containing protein n=1 Tax=Colletotrichum fructicola (strain Nara gc5) TaxID=1213859 RepID=A0A7J6J0Y5_COLFN|nr:hypothetical protein CGGC5_v008730 [Colletotrichum fructicola Nara gc5]